MDDKIEDNKFNWNEIVRVKSIAPEYLHPGKIASICGMEKVKFEDIAQEYHIKVGEWVYTIEFNNGNDVTIPETYLEKIIQSKK